MKLTKAEREEARKDWRKTFNILYKMWKEVECTHREKAKLYGDCMVFINVIFFNMTYPQFDERVIKAFINDGWEEYDDEGHCYRDFDRFYSKVCEIFYK